MTPSKSGGGFVVGDRVRYTGSDRTSAHRAHIGKVGTVVQIKTADNIQVEFDHDGEKWGCYPWNIERIDTQPKPGERVRVTIEGVVEGGALTPNRLKVQTSKKALFFPTDDPTFKVEVIEPKYETGAVVKDAAGEFWRKHPDGGWQAFGDARWHSHETPVRPLKALS